MKMVNVMKKKLNLNAGHGMLLASYSNWELKVSP